MNTITVAELLSDAGRDVRAAWERGECTISRDGTVLLSPFEGYSIWAARCRTGDGGRILIALNHTLEVLWHEGFAPSDPLALAEAALREIVAVLEGNLLDEPKGNLYYRICTARIHTADALAAIEAARKP